MSDAKPIIAYNNLLANPLVTLTASDESLGSVENIRDWRTYTRWGGVGTFPGATTLLIDCGSTQIVSCFGIVGHNLFSKGFTSVGVQGSPDGMSWTLLTWGSLGTFEMTPTSDGAIFRKFVQSYQFRYFMLSFSAPGPARDFEIAIVYLGDCVQFPEYILPGFDPDGRKIITESSVSQQGNLLGIVRKYANRDIIADFGELENDWVETNLFPFEATWPQPFIWAWDVTNHADEVYLVRSAKPDILHPTVDNLRNVQLEMIGVKDPGEAV
jgi:hypothetical protein